MCQIKMIKDVGIEDSTFKVKQMIGNTLRLIGIHIIVKEIKSYKTKDKMLKKVESNDIQYTPAKNLKSGDIVRVRSKEQIQKTLNKENKFEGCFFMNEMWQYCGRQQKVLKKVEYFFDERTAKLYKARNIVLLERVHCSGSQGNFIPKCDRNCYIFWKEEWLEKIE